MDVGLNLGDFDAMTATVRIEWGDSEKVNVCSGLVWPLAVCLAGDGPL